MFESGPLPIKIGDAMGQVVEIEGVFDKDRRCESIRLSCRYSKDVQNEEGFYEMRWFNRDFFLNEEVFLRDGILTVVKTS